MGDGHKKNAKAVIVYKYPTHEISFDHPHNWRRNFFYGVRDKIKAGLAFKNNGMGSYYWQGFD